jgi:hypothetical protein
MRGELANLTRLRFVLGLVGGIALPFWLSAFIDPHTAVVPVGSGPLLIAALGTLCLVAGEFAERSLFFMAAASPKMPGAVGK